MSAGLLYGPMLVGVFLNCILYGVTVVQGYLYYQTCKSDGWWMKVFVSYLLLCETLSTIFDIGVIYEPLIIHNGSPKVFRVAPIMLSANPAVTVMISFPVQLFIAWRVKVMSKSVILPTIIILFAVASFIGGITTSVLVVLIDFQYSLFPKNDGAVIAWLASSAVADIMITTSLVFSLLRKRTGFAATDSIIHKVIRLSVQTGSITSVSAILDVMLFLLLRGKTWNFICDFPLSKLYSNSLLSTLNARGGWRHPPSVRDNVLFANEESRARSRSQVETVTDVQMMPMKTFDSGSGSYHHNRSTSAINVQEFGEGL